MKRSHDGSTGCLKAIILYVRTCQNKYFTDRYISFTRTRGIISINRPHTRGPIVSIASTDPTHVEVYLMKAQKCRVDRCLHDATSETARASIHRKGCALEKTYYIFWIACTCSFYKLERVGCLTSCGSHDHLLLSLFSGKYTPYLGSANID